MNSIYNKKIITFVATLLAVFVACAMLALQPVSAKTLKKPYKVKNVDVATFYNAKMVEFGDETSAYIAPVTIKWDKAKRATKYQVAYKEEAAKAWKYKTVKSTSLKIQDYNYKSKNLSPNTICRVKVRAINKTKKGNWSKVVRFRTRAVEYAQPGDVEGLKVIEKCEYSDGYSPIVLKWDKAENAEKYEIAYTNGHVDWASIESNTNTAKVVELNPYCKYEFKVRAINGDKIGNWSESIKAMTRVNSVEIDFPTITNFRITKQGLGSLTMSWDADYSAYSEKKIVDNKHISYNVYRSTDKKDWTLTADHIKDTTFTQRYCDMNVVYFFKVVPVDNESYKEFDYSGEESSIISEKVKDIGVKLVQRYTTASSDYLLNRDYNYRGAMLHSVGRAEENAEWWVDYYNDYDAPASVHGFIDGPTGVLYQTFDWTMRGGHAGPAANNRYVAIEMCESKYLMYDENEVLLGVEPGHEAEAKATTARTYNTAVKLFAVICDYFGFDPLEPGTIVSHKEWSVDYKNGGYRDPDPMWDKLGMGYTMDGFRQEVAALLN